MGSATANPTRIARFSNETPNWEATELRIKAYQFRLILRGAGLMVPTNGRSKEQTESGMQMRLFVKFFEALANSQQLKADRVIRERYHLLEEAQAYVRRREIEAASNNAGRVLLKSFTIGAQLVSPQIFTHTLSENSEKMTAMPTAPSEMGGNKIMENTQSLRL